MRDWLEAYKDSQNLWPKVVTTPPPWPLTVDVDVDADAEARID